MKTLGKSFAYIFMALALTAFVAGFFNAPHQFALAGLCVVMALVMWPGDNQHKTSNIE